MNTGRLQFRHFDSIFDTREQAYNYLAQIVDPAKREDYRLKETLVGEPILVRYKDGEGNVQALVAIGTIGETGEGAFGPYHIIDTAKLEEDIAAISGATSGASEDLQNEIERAMTAESELQDEIDATQIGAGLESDGSYSPNDESEYIKQATSLKDADNKLDSELARVEKARKDVTGQNTDEYVPNQSLVSRPIAYIDNAESLNDADIKLDKAIQDLSKEILANVEVNGVEGVIDNNIAKVSISGDSIPIGPYDGHIIPENPSGNPHPIHESYSVLDAVKQLDINFEDLKNVLNSEVDGLHLVKVTTGLDSNVREAYDLVNADGVPQENSARVLIYKDSSLYTAYLGHMDDYLADYTSPVVTPGTGDTALCFIYLKTDGTYQLIPVNVESFLEESEFLDGLRTDNHKVYVKIDANSEPFLTVSPDGVKISGIQDAIDSESARAQTAEQEIRNSVNSLSSSTIAEIVRLDNKIEDESARAEAAENAISGVVNSFSSSTVAEIARLDAASVRNKIKSTGETIVVTESAEGTNIEANIDGKTILSNNGILETGLKIVELPVSELEANVREAYRLVDNNGNRINDTVVKIYKSSSLVNVELISIGGIDYVRITYIDNEGQTRYMDLNIQELIFEAEFKDGLDVNANGEVRVKIDELSEPFLTVSQSGVKLSGIQNAIDTAQSEEQARAEASENAISGKVSTLSSSTVNEVSRLDNKIDDEITRAEVAENEINDTIDTFSAATVSEINRIDNALTAGTTEIVELSAATVGLSGATASEINRATLAENSISGSVNTLSACTAEEIARATLAETNLSNRILTLENVSVTAEKAINIDNSVAGADKKITLVIDTDDNVLSQSNNGLKTTLKLNYDSQSQKVQLLGIGNDVISEFDSSDFIKDGMIQSVTFNPSTQKLTITWNTAAGHDSTIIDLSSLVDVYTVDDNSAKYLAINDYVLSAKVDVTDGLASNNRVQAIEDEIDVLEDTWNTPGSIKHTLDDSLVKSMAVGTAEAANKSLLRYFNDGAEHKYYASNDTADMEHKGNNLSTVIETINNTILSLSGGSEVVISAMTEKIESVSASVVTLDRKVTVLSGDVATISGDVHTLSGSVVTLSGDVAELSGSVIQLSASTINEVDRVDDRIDELSGSVVTLIESGAGLNADGTYNQHDEPSEGMAYINTATSIDNATVLLDKGLQQEVTRATNAENSISGIVDSFSASVVNIISSMTGDTGSTNEKIQELSGNVETLSGHVITVSGNVITLSGDVQTISGNVITISGDVQTLSGNVITLSGNVVTLSGDVATISGDVITLSGDVSTISSATNDIQNELDAAEAGAGLNPDGTYKQHSALGDTANYISGATSIDNATVILDSALKAEETRAINAENSISGNVTTLSGSVEAFSASVTNIINTITGDTGSTNEKIEIISGDVITLSGNLITLSGSVVTLSGDVQSISGDVITLSGNVVTLSGDVATISGDVITLSGSVVTLSGDVATISGDVITLSGNVVTLSGDVTTISGDVITLSGDVQALSGELITTKEELSAVSATLVTLLSEFDDKVYAAVKDILKGTNREIKVTSDDTQETLTVGFADDAIFGPISLG